LGCAFSGHAFSWHGCDGALVWHGFAARMLVGHALAGHVFVAHAVAICLVPPVSALGTMPVDSSIFYLITCPVNVIIHSTTPHHDVMGFA